MGFVFEVQAALPSGNLLPLLVLYLKITVATLESIRMNERRTNGRTNVLYE
jgi:hypothetical protein